MQLTTAQKTLLRTAPAEGYDFIILTSAAQDRVARSLSRKGLGYFSSFASQYPWRRRSGYINHFTPNAAGRALAAQA